MRTTQSGWRTTSATERLVRRSRRSLAAIIVLSALVALRAAGAFAQAAPAVAPSTLAGIVRDSSGRPVSDAEVILRDANRGTRTNDRGEFTLADVPPGKYLVWFRRLGYTSVEYNWLARSGERTEIRVKLTPIARALDPVVVRAEEEKRAKGRSSILGLVVDTEGKPIDEAEVQLVGADRAAVTRENGGFLFRPLPVGNYVVRVRKLGYEPNIITLELQDADDREVIVRMHPLAASLDPMTVTERSGYGRDQQRYDDLDRRMRWHNFRSYVLGPDELRRYQGLPLDWAAKAIGVPSGVKNRGPTSISGRGTSAPRGMPDDESACILLNGKTGLYQPLRSFNVKDIELLEIWPGGTEITGTVGDRVHDPCKPISLLSHPTYYVIWLKGDK
jgi:hypothetical protein